MEKIIYWFACALSSAKGFLITNLLNVVGLVYCWAAGFADSSLLAFTLYLSIAAITITGAVLVAQERGTAALHLKLDDIIAHSRASNRMIGIEEAPAEKLQKERRRISRKAGGRR